MLKPILFNTEMVQAIMDGRKTVTRRIIKPQPQMQLSYTSAGNDNGKWSYPDTAISDQEKQKVWTPPCHKNDILYVRETWDSLPVNLDGTLCGYDRYYYKADSDRRPKGWKSAWKPSIHMPKDAARIFLKVTNVRVEMLQDITEEQAKTEGICRLYDDMSKEEYEKWARKVGQMETQEECLFRNYLWHGNFGKYGTGNKLSDSWEYQYSGYDDAIGSFSSLWNTMVPLNNWERYGWSANPWVWVIKFEMCEKPSE